MDAGLPKLAWVMAPLAVAAAVLAWRWLRGRPPTRLALNVWASLLLLVYLLATAGLGVFWVAQQQLPVFDWHYLFGYATLLLLVVHLWLNLGVVWRYLVRWVRPAVGRARPTGDGPGPSVAPATARARPGGRRLAMGLVAAVAASAGAAWLGWRRGHEAGRLQALAELGGGTGRAAGAADGPDDTVALALVERFHALSSSVRRGGLPGAPPVSWGDPPPPFKRLPATGGLVPLPAPLRAPDPAATPLLALATALWHTAAVTLARGSLALRASPSSGALFATELHVIARAVPGLPAGTWHYDVPRHALVAVPVPAVPALAEVAAAAVGDAAAAVVATGVFRRTGYKYRDRAYRYMLADLGHALENLRLAAAAAGLPLRLMHGFDEAGLAAALALDAAEEGVLMLARVGADDGARVAGWPPRTEVVPAEGTGSLGLTHVIHRASHWQARAEAAGAPAAAGGAGPGVATPGPEPWPGDPLALIARRRSRRRFAASPLPAGTAVTMLAALQADRPLLSTALTVHLVVHAAEDLAPGVWHWDAARRALRPGRGGGDLRRASRAAALDQDVIGDAAAVLVLGLARDRWRADPGGPARGYRHGLLEAGLAGERWYLQAEALGLGACGVGAFFDDEAAALVGVDPAREWIVHVAALGVPAAG